MHSSKHMNSLCLLFTEKNMQSKHNISCLDDNKNSRLGLSTKSASLC